MPEEKTAQIRAKSPNIIHSEEEYVTPTRARFLIGTGQFYLVNAPVGPSETKPAGPSEVKESLEKKSFDIAPAGQSTDFPKSSEPGTDVQSSALPADPALQPSNADTLKRRPGRPRKGT